MYIPSDQKVKNHKSSVDGEKNQVAKPIMAEDLNAGSALPGEL